MSNIVALHLVSCGRVSLNLELICLTGLAGQQAPGSCPSLPSPALGLQTCARFYMGAEDPNAGLHAYMASALPTEPAPQPSSCILTVMLILGILLELPVLTTECFVIGHTVRI